MNKSELITTLIRVSVTFVQGFFAVWATSGFKTDKLALGGAVAAAASLVYNIVIKPQLEKLNSIEGA